MYVVLIPFFLAANLSVDNNERWVHGPEFRYDGEILTTMGNKMEGDYRLRIEYSLRCRIRDPERMVCLMPHCSFEESVVRDPENFVEMRRELMTTPFGLGFSEKGVESVAITQNNTRGLSLLQLIAMQFSIGTDLTQRTTTPQFEVTELGLFGDCDALYEVEVKTDDESSEESSAGNNYDLILIPYANLKSDLKYEIKKTRDVNSCTFNPRADNSVEERNTPDLSAFKSKIIMTNRGMFQSETEIHNKRKQKYGPRLVTLDNRTLATLKLVDIVKAEEPITPILDPRVYSINMYDDLE